MSSASAVAHVEKEAEQAEGDEDLDWATVVVELVGRGLR